MFKYRQANGGLIMLSLWALLFEADLLELKGDYRIRWMIWRMAEQGSLTPQAVIRCLYCDIVSVEGLRIMLRVERILVSGKPANKVPYPEAVSTALPLGHRAIHGTGGLWKIRDWGIISSVQEWWERHPLSVEERRKNAIPLRVIFEKLLSSTPAA